jgi:hypothetical protein
MNALYCILILGLLYVCIKYSYFFRSMTVTSFLCNLIWIEITASICLLMQIAVYKTYTPCTGTLIFYGSINFCFYPGNQKLANI